MIYDSELDDYITDYEYDYGDEKCSYNDFHCHKKTINSRVNNKFTSCLDEILEKITVIKEPEEETKSSPKQSKSRSKKHYSKKHKKKIRWHYLNNREAKFAKRIGYNPKHQSPKQVSDSLKLISIIAQMNISDEKWTRTPLYELYAYIIDARIIVIDGIKTLQHLYSFSEYKDMTFQQLKDKIDYLIKKFKQKRYIEIGEHQAGYKAYAKDFRFCFSYGRILKRCRIEDSLHPPKELTHTLSNGILPIVDQSSSFFDKVKSICYKIFKSEDRKKQHSYYNYFQQVHQQQRQITSDLISTISDMGKLTINIGKGKTKDLRHLWIKRLINKKTGIAFFHIKGSNKNAIQMYKEIYKTVREMKYGRTERELESALALIRFLSDQIKNIIFSISRDTFLPKPKPPKLLKAPIIEPTKFEQRLFDRIKSFGIPIFIKQLIFDHAKKTIAIIDSIKHSKLIKQSIEEAKSNNPKGFNFKLKDGTIYSFIA